MADHGPSLGGRIATAIPYVLPVLGGLLGVIWVNLNPKDLINPFIALAVGVFLGWAASRGVTWMLNRRG